MQAVAVHQIPCQLRLMRLVAVLAVLASLTVEAPAMAADAQKTCISLREAGAQATFSGILTLQLFAGPPNYESIAKGDAEERAFILELPSRRCADDGEFIGPNASFDRVQVSASDEAMLGVLKAAVGRTVTVRGEAFGAHTGHHHAALVLVADKATVVGKVR